MEEEAVFGDGGVVEVDGAVFDFEVDAGLGEAGGDGGEDEGFVLDHGGRW